MNSSTLAWGWDSNAEYAGLQKLKQVEEKNGDV